MSKTLDQSVKEARRAYFRQWRQNNPEKVKKHREDFWRRQAEKELKEQQDQEAK